MLKLPFNRFVTFVKPYLNILAAALAAWLVAKLNVLGFHGLDQNNAATWISAALVFILTHAGQTLGDSKWLKGHHIELTNAGQALQPLPLLMSGTVGGPDEEDPVADVSGVQDL